MNETIPTKGHKGGSEQSNQKLCLAKVDAEK
jgi:hypothetical protein